MFKLMLEGSSAVKRNPIFHGANKKVNKKIRDEIYIVNWFQDLRSFDNRE